MYSAVFKTCGTPVFLQIKNTPTSSWWKIYSTTLLWGYVPSSHSLVVQGRECTADFTKDLLTSVFNNMSDLVAEVRWLCVQSQQVWRTNLVFLFFLFLIYDNAVRYRHKIGNRKWGFQFDTVEWKWRYVSASKCKTKLFSRFDCSSEAEHSEYALVCSSEAEYSEYALVDTIMALIDHTWDVLNWGVWCRPQKPATFAHIPQVLHEECLEQLYTRRFIISIKTSSTKCRC